jgi:hypothetical protein
MENENTIPIGSSGLIIYDGSCGACSKFIGERNVFFEKYGFTVTPLQNEWVSELTGIDQETLMKSIHLLLPDGKILQGADFFGYLSGKVWWLTPLHAILKIALVKRIFNRFYGYVARRRKKISAICQLKAETKYRE